MKHLLIAGVNKAGTTSLHDYLCRSTRVVGGKRKELGYFLPIRYGSDVLATPIAAYLKSFDLPDLDCYALDSTPGYFYGERKICQYIKRSLSDVRVIICLREPYDRLRSFYDFHLNQNNIPSDLTPREYVFACAGLNAGDLSDRKKNAYFGVEGGFYSKYLPAWMDEFRGRLFLVDFSRLASDPEALVAEIADFLDLPRSSFGEGQYGTSNKTRLYRSRRLHGIATHINERYGHFLFRSRNFTKASKAFYRKLNESSQDLEAEKKLGEFRELKTYESERLALAELLINTDYSASLSWLR